MSNVHFCLILKLNSETLFEDDTPEENYQKYFKPVLSFFYSHGSFAFSIYSSGLVLSWLESNHPEVFSIFSEMAARKQLEFLGGGYYEPLFPLLLPLDRVGQTELLTTALRKATGKRPRGIWLEKSAWDNSLVPVIKSSGMDYVILEKNGFLGTDPYQTAVLEDGGKKISALFCDNSFFSDSSVSAESLLKEVLKAEQKHDKTSVFCAGITPYQMSHYMDSAYFDACAESFAEKGIQFSTPNKFLKSATIFNRAYLPAYTADKNQSVKEMIVQNNDSWDLYSRTLVVSQEINQFKGDKLRKNAARIELWQSQFCRCYLDSSKNREYRRNAYKHLLEAEKIMAELSSGPASDCIADDYNSDGYPEYIFNFSIYNAILSSQGGTLTELDVRNSCQLYTDCNPVNSEAYTRKVFSDYLLSEEDFESVYKSQNHQLLNVLTQDHYSELTFSRAKRDLQLSETGVFAQNQKFSLKKRYDLSETGIQVQYIIKNESPLPIKGIFAVESNLVLPQKGPADRSVEIISNDTHESVAFESENFRPKDVSCIQISDESTETAFIFEPNENAGILISPLYDNEIPVSTCATLFWNVDMPAGYEIEKTLFLGIRAPGKKSLVQKGSKKGKH